MINSEKTQLSSKAIDDGELWSFLRSVLSQGGDIWLDHAARSYEQYSARLDAAARERVDALKALISPSHETCEWCTAGVPRSKDGARHDSIYGVWACRTPTLKAVPVETLPDTLVRWMSLDTWRCRCTSPGNVNIKLCNYCGGCGTHRPDKSEGEDRG